MTEAKKLVVRYGSPPLLHAVAIALVRALREAVARDEDWSTVLDFIDKLPEDLAKEAEFREHRAFALSNVGQHVASITELNTLIELFRPTPERLGLLGGRYKRLMNSAATEPDRNYFLNLAISAYQRGMDLDLNEYYCSSNLPRAAHSAGAFPADQELRYVRLHR
jgi:hypothetical protein